MGPTAAFSFSSTCVPPLELVEALRAGECIAFVGSGFSQPLQPSWWRLLCELALRVPAKPTSDNLVAWLNRKDKPLTSQDLEAVAEIIHRALGDDLAHHLAEVLGASAAAEDRHRGQFAWRKDRLTQIPFRGVLTTNFDTLVDGELPSPREYGRFLAVEPSPWWRSRRWARSASSGGVPVLKLHGDLSRPSPSVVFTARQYRTLIHETPGYRAFLRTLFATSSVLFLGFSFSDAYINDLRSEVLAMIGLDPNRRRFRDFAVLANLSDEMKDHLADVEGLVPLPYVAPEGDREHRGFDAWLASIASETNPEATLRARLKGKRILWLDEQPTNNDHGFAVLSQTDGGAAIIDAVTSVPRALELLAVGNGADTTGGYDVVITHWGYKGGTERANAENLLLEMRARGLFAPVIVFASGLHRHENRARALRFGALAYTSSWPELFKTLDDLVRDPGIGRA